MLVIVLKIALYPLFFVARMRSSNREKVFFYSKAQMSTAFKSKERLCFQPLSSCCFSTAKRCRMDELWLNRPS
jgi:hypothetical protein